jgi:hypothetical protein
MALESFADVQAFFNNFMSQNNIQILQAPHGAFWMTSPDNNISYNNFVNGNVPGGQAVADPNGNPVPILKIGDGAHSNIVYALAGTAGTWWDKNDPNAWFGQMPAGGPYFSDTQVQELSDWITNGCHQFGTAATT